MDNKTQSKDSYGSSSIKVLEGLEGVRLRPAMYIGSTSKQGLHHLVYETVDNSVDEAMGGFCKNIDVTLNKDGSVTVTDDGRGIPVDPHPVYKIPALEVVITKLHAGGKFDKGSYTISGGLHGVGISVVAALSKKMKVIVKRDGKIHQQEYTIGKTDYKLKIIGSCPKNETGTEVIFFPDETIFSTTQFDFSILQTRFREIAFLNKGVKITLKDEITGKKETFSYEGGIMEFVKWVNKSKEVIHAKPIYFLKEDSGVIVECAIQYNVGYQENVLGFVNTINTVEGGTHVAGFRTALTRALNDYANKNKLIKDENLTGDDVREGLTAIISVKVPEPQFEGQTKTKLGNSEVKGIVDSASMSSLQEFLEENPAIARKIVGKCLDAQKARTAAKKAKDLVRRKTAFGGAGLPGKLAECSKRKAEDTELYIVEGDSAGGCFSGDTKIALADGRNLNFLELIEEDKQGKKNFCYTIKENNEIGIEKIQSPRITKRNAQVVKITLDNDEEIICTPNHKFMLRDGSYKEAQQIATSDSLTPLYRKLSKMGGRITIEGYEMILNLNKWIFTHMLADEYNLKQDVYSKSQGEARHHIDFNKLNNNPTNLIRLSKEEHLLIHTENLTKTLHRKDVKEKTALAHKDPEYRSKVSAWARSPEVNEMLKQRAKKQWQNESYKKFMTQKFIEFYESNESYRQENNKKLNESQKKYWADKENRNLASQRVIDFFENHPEAKEYLKKIVKEEWKNSLLLDWRKQKTKEQWTPEFREKRKAAYNKTYFNNTINLMKKVIELNGSLDKFDTIRIKTNNKNILSLNTFCTRFFNGHKEAMLEAINNWNHKITKIEFLQEKIDVYDIEVPNTHNFALASGVFVHNSAKQARNRDNQAILPLRGKILNVEKANPSKALSSEEIANLITAIGTGVGDQYEQEKLRYSKIIIMTDADVDGAHISILLMTFFFRFMPDLIKNGNVYLAVPPLYRIRKRKTHYVYSDEELKKLTSKLGDKVDVQRFKGLGEMNPEQLWETTMDPKTRLLKRVTIEDVTTADETFSKLMGDDVEERRQFIAEHAHEAEIDV